MTDQTRPSVPVDEAAYGVPADVPESAVSPCGKTSTHAHHDWVEQTGSADFEHYWCPGVAPGDSGASS